MNWVRHGSSTTSIGSPPSPRPSPPQKPHSRTQSSSESSGSLVMGWSPGETLSFPVLQKKKGNKRFFCRKIYLRWGQFFFKFWNSGVKPENVTQSANCAITLSARSRTWAESSSLHRSVLRRLIQSYFERNIPLFWPCQEEKFMLLESAWQRWVMR